MQTYEIQHGYVSAVGIGDENNEYSVCGFANLIPGRLSYNCYIYQSCVLPLIYIVQRNADIIRSREIFNQNSQ